MMEKCKISCFFTIAGEKIRLSSKKYDFLTIGGRQMTALTIIIAGAALAIGVFVGWAVNWYEE